MGEKQLEAVMTKFMHHEFDVLVATTIIENGLDIPLANTLIVNRADRYGLSQLYQLRGRVGRSNRRAYAYLLIPSRCAGSGVTGSRQLARGPATRSHRGNRIRSVLPAFGKNNRGGPNGRSSAGSGDGDQSQVGFEDSGRFHRGGASAPAHLQTDCVLAQRSRGG